MYIRVRRYEYREKVTPKRGALTTKERATTKAGCAPPKRILTCLAALFCGAHAVVAELLLLVLDRGVVVRAAVARAHGLAALLNGALAVPALERLVAGGGDVPIRAPDAAAHGRIFPRRGL